MRNGFVFDICKCSFWLDLGSAPKGNLPLKYDTISPPSVSVIPNDTGITVDAYCEEMNTMMKEFPAGFGQLLVSAAPA